MGSMKNINRPIGVNDDHTPTTHTPIPQVSSDTWHLLNVTDLIEQRSFLQGRLVLAMTSQNPSLTHPIFQGIARLDELIDRAQQQEQQQQQQQQPTNNIPTGRL